MACEAWLSGSLWRNHCRISWKTETFFYSCFLARSKKRWGRQVEKNFKNLKQAETCRSIKKPNGYTGLVSFVILPECKNSKYYKESQGSLEHFLTHGNQLQYVILPYTSVFRSNTQRELLWSSSWILMLRVKLLCCTLRCSICLFVCLFGCFLYCNIQEAVLPFVY